MTDDDFFAPLLKRGTIRAYPGKSLILNEGDEGRSLLLVIEGKLKVFSSGEDGKQFTLALCGPGDVVGELALDGEPRCASVMTMEESRCALVRHDVLQELVRTDADFALAFIYRLIRRTRNTTKTAKGLALGNVYKRVAGLLNGMATTTNFPCGLKERLTQQEIADQVGASRDMTRRILAELTQGGYIKMDGRDIRLLRKLPRDW